MSYDAKSIEKQLQRLYNEWQDIYNGNGHSPWYPDGWSCNHIRSMITNIKEMMEKEVDAIALPEIYYRKLPIELPSEQMFNSRTLLHGGNQGLKKREQKKKETEPIQSMDD